MSTQTTAEAIDAYVDRCRRYLSDLDLHQQDQLSEDVAQIATEVAAELDGTLDDLLGVPERFVRELRLAAGVPMPPEASSADPDAGTRSWTDTIAALWHHPAADWTRTLAVELRPAWWVARGLALVVLLSWWTSVDSIVWFAIVPIPALFDSALIGFAATAAAVHASVRAGRCPHRGRARALRAALSAVALVVGLLAWDQLTDNLRRSGDADIVESYDLGYEAARLGDAAFSPLDVDVTSPGAHEIPLGAVGRVLVGSEAGGSPTVVTSVSEAEAALVSAIQQGQQPTSLFVEHDSIRTPITSIEQAVATLESLVASGLLAP